ncbi:hypothetical protein [Comamonas humi]
MEPSLRFFLPSMHHVGAFAPVRVGAPLCTSMGKNAGDGKGWAGKGVVNLQI